MTRKNLFLLIWCCLLGGPGITTAQGVRLGGAGDAELSVENCRTINSPGAEFAPAIYRDRLVYLARPRRGSIDPLTQQPYFKLFSAPRNEESLPGRGKRLSSALSDGYNEGPASFTQSDQVIYFTRTLPDAGPRNGPVNLGLYSAFDDGYDWADVRALPYNAPAYATQHPSLTSEGRRLFFASNRPGGFGGYDLYFADYRDGNWGAPVNLGPEINTEGNEAFPHIHANRMLFFASDGHPGQGGYDLFRIDIGERVWGQLAPLPAPVNSPQDDISFVLSADARQAYFASNRPGGLGKDDIYKVSLRRGLASLATDRYRKETLSVFDEASSKRLAGARVTVAPLSGSGRLPAGAARFEQAGRGGERKIAQRPAPAGAVTSREYLYTDQRGQLPYTFDAEKRYYVSVSKAGYEAVAFEYDPNEAGAGAQLTLALRNKDCRDVYGRVVRANGGAAAGAEVVGKGSAGAHVRARTDRDGYFTLCLPLGTDYAITANQSGTPADTVTLSQERIRADAPLRPVLRLPEAAPTGNTDRRWVDAVLELPDIRYPYLSANPVEEESPDLTVLLEFLRSFPELNVALIVHAHGPENEITLQRLTEERAVRLRNYLTARGVDADRLRTVAYGDQFPLRQCDDCRPEDYLYNTRILAKVVDWE